MNDVDAAWRELELDALASDGPIRDADVKDAIKRQRPSIEAVVRIAALNEAKRAIDALVEPGYYDPRIDKALAAIDRLRDGT